MKKLLIVGVLAVVCGFGGCKVMEAMFSPAEPTPAEVVQLEGLKSIASDLVAESALLQQDIVLATDPADRAKMQVRLDKVNTQINLINEAIQTAQTPGDVGWNIGEIVLAAIGGFIPGVSVIGIPLWNSLRRLTKKTVPAIFESVREGDGPVNPTAAKIALLKNPAARKLYERWKNKSKPSLNPTLSGPTPDPVT